MNEPAPSTRAYGRHVFVCNGGSCAPPEQAEGLRASVKNSLGTLVKLRNPERVKWSLSECLGVCSGGPVVVVYPEGIWYHHVDQAAMQRIVEEHLVGGQPVEEFIFHRLYPSEQTPGYAPQLRGDAGTFVGASASSLGLKPASKEATNKRVESVVPSSDSRSFEQREAARIEARRAKRKKGLVIVNTGDGKGKTTAALGIITRAWGRRMRTGLLQFMKRDSSRVGEILALEKMGVERIGLGDGFTWTSKDLDETEARAVAGWQLAQERIVSGNYEILVLDEFTYPLHFGWLNAREVVSWLKAHKPPELHLVITGRDAAPELVEHADLVTEMRNIKHPFELQGIRAQRGIDY